MTAMPTWDQFMAPVLRALLDGEVCQRRALVRRVAESERITDAQMAITISSGQPMLDNRIGWATSYLNRAGAIERPNRGYYRITEIGRALLAEHPAGIAERHLGQRSFRRGGTSWPSTTTTLSPTSAETPLDPVEQIETGIARIHADVADDLLSRLHAQEPAFFEQAVLDLLIAMGYGGADGQATRTQLSNDGGIDGVVDQDALGLSRIYVQAKRYARDNAVGRPEIQAFVGALHGNAANRGVFMTTSHVSTAARDYAAGLPMRVVLLDGTRLASLMIRFGVGVQVRRTLQIVEVDEDFFE